MFSNGEQNVARLGLKEGMLVADLGTGTGFYARAAGNHVGHTGKVYAVEVQKDLVKKLQDELQREGISNVECIWGDIERKGGTKIAEKTMDAVIASNVLFQVEDKIGFINEIKRILKPKGQVLIIDWTESFGGMGPHPDKVITENKALELFTSRGFKKVENISTLTHHYGIIFNSNE